MMPPSVESLQRRIADLSSRLAVCEKESEHLQTELEDVGPDSETEVDLERAQALLELVQNLRRHGESPRLAETWAEADSQIQVFLREIW